MNRVLALDLGTTSNRAIVFDAECRIQGVAQRELPQSFPQPGWVEHDPVRIWRDTLACALEALAQAHCPARELAGIGITNQRETLVLWDRASGEPLAPAIVWQDRRTAADCAARKAAGEQAMVRERTGLLLDPYFSATKLGWLLDNLPQARQRAERGKLACGTIDSWLIWCLTGGDAHVTDPTNASRTLLFALDGADWDDDLLRLFNIPRSLLPVIVPSSGIAGHCRAEHLGAEIPIAGIAGDQQAALFGQCAFAAGEAKNTYGTGCFLLAHAGSMPPVPPQGLLTTRAASADGNAVYALEGAVFTAGAAIQWLRDGLGLIRHARDIESLAASVNDSGDVVFVPAFTGLGSPHWDPLARGLLIGLTRGTRPGHIARATLEAIALQTADLLTAMQPVLPPLSALHVDGGAAANDLLLQLQADLLDLPVIRPAQLETTALGAAALAGLACGVWASPAAFAEHRLIDRHFDPAMPATERRQRSDRWRDAVSRAGGWATP